MPFRFEGLDIWHQAVELSNEAYKFVVKFPDHEKYGLANQMTRAANSVSLNIAEGAERDTDADFNRFLGIAVGSTLEVVAASFLALNQGYVLKETHAVLYARAEKLAKTINRFRHTLRR